MSKSKECGASLKSCDGRREFLVKAGSIAGGLVLSLAGTEIAQAGVTGAPQEEEVVIKIDDKSPLNKVGGSQTIETKSGKVIVARTSEASFVALSAVCTHRGGSINYDEGTKTFVCPNHGSKFGSDGANSGGPAKKPLAAHSAQNALVVAIKG
jgi:Rieske Fe-S protein